MSSFRQTRSRDASPAIRGYVYQVDRTIARWLDLHPRQELHLECGEDIDVVTPVVEARIDGLPVDQRLLEQVKNLHGSITIRTEGVLETIANAVEHRHNNPGIDLFFRFATNAPISMEARAPTRGLALPFGPRTPALEVWQHLCASADDASHHTTELAGLRAFLRHARRPGQFNPGTWSRFEGFIEHAPDADFLSFIRRVEWGVALGDAREQASAITAQLRANDRAHDEAHAQDLYQRLFLHVFTLLAREGPKRLTVVDRARLMERPTPGADDRARLAGVQSLLANVQARVGVLEHQGEMHGTIIRTLEARVDSVETSTREAHQRLERVEAGTMDMTVARPTVSMAVHGGNLNWGEAGVVFGALIGHVRGATKSQIEHAQDLWRRGKGKDAEQELRRITGDPTVWSDVLPRELKASVRLLEAVLALDRRGDIAGATRLIDEARELDARDDDARIRALIVRREAGPAAALPLLDGREDVDSSHMRAAFLLDLGESARSLEILDRLDAVGVADAESMRLRALAYLLAGDLDRAEGCAREALDGEPSWVAMRYTAAVIDYFRALSPAARPDRPPSWPQPVGAIEIRRDDVGVAYLDRAARAFHGLCQDLDKGSDEHQSAQAWYLASLANIPARRAHASAWCRECLRADPTAPYMVIWAVARDLDVDLAGSVRDIDRLVAEKRASLPHILALAYWHLRDGRSPAEKKGRPDKAIRLLKKTKGAFVAQREDGLWWLWYVQALIDNAAPDQALTAIASAPDPDALWHLRAAALRAIAEKTEKASNWDDLLAHLEHRHATTGDPSALLAACQVMFRRREWAYVIQRSDQLIAEWGTAEAVRLAALAAFYARRFERCLTILDAHLDYFPHRSPRGGLRQARIMCLDERGRRPEAIGDALGWVADENSAEAILTLLRLYRDDGDLAALTVHARGLRGRADLTPEQALRGAALVRHEDGPLARELWDKAVHHPDLPDDAVASAWMLGREIRFAQELRPLGPRLPAAAAKCFQID